MRMYQNERGKLKYKRQSRTQLSSDRFKTTAVLYEKFSRWEQRQNQQSSWSFSNSLILSQFSFLFFLYTSIMKYNQSFVHQVYHRNDSSISFPQSANKRNWPSERTNSFRKESRKGDNFSCYRKGSIINLCTFITFFLRESKCRWSHFLLSFYSVPHYCPWFHSTLPWHHLQTIISSKNR